MRQTLNPPAYEHWRESSNSQVLLMNLPILQLQRQLVRLKQQCESLMQMQVKRRVNVL